MDAAKFGRKIESPDEIRVTAMLIRSRR